MRITQYQNRTTISCSDHEFAIMKIAVERLGIEGKKIFPTTGLRRSWSRRILGGDFLRIDKTVRID